MLRLTRSQTKVNDFFRFLKGVFFLPVFKTIRQTAATGILPEHRLRIMVASGECPGFYSGNRFMVNVTALSEQLDAESRAAVSKEVPI